MDLYHEVLFLALPQTGVRRFARPDGIWSSRYRAIVVSQEEAAQIERLRYVLSHGCKEGLVGRPRDWPGVHAVRALVADEVVEGYWFSRTLEYAARRRGEDFGRLQYATRETVTLTPLPCWKDLSTEAWKRRLTSLVGEIEAEAAARRKRTGSQPLGLGALLSRHPHHRPARLEKSPAPSFHAILPEATARPTRPW